MGTEDARRAPLLRTAAGVLLVPLLLGLSASAAWAAGTEITLRGKVVDGEGEPVRDARVLLSPARDPDSEDAEEPWREELQTNRKGRFSYFLIQGHLKVQIRVEKDGYRPVEQVVQPVVLASETERRSGLGRGADSVFQVEIVLDTAEVPLDDPNLDVDAMDPELRRATALRLYNEGVSAARDGRPDDAVSSLERSLALMPDLVPARVTLGKVLFESGRFEDAADAFAAAAEVAPPTAEVLELTYHANRRAGRRDRAVAALEELWQRQPERAQDEMFELATIYRAEGDLDQARAAVEKVIGLRPRDANSRYFYGRLLFAMDDVDGAMEQFRLFLDLDPDSPRAEAVRNKLEELGADR